MGVVKVVLVTMGISLTALTLMVIVCSEEAKLFSSKTLYVRVLGVTPGRKLL